MRVTRRLGSAIVAFSVTLALATGCGDDQVKDNNRYVAATDRVVQEFETKFQSLQADFTPVSTPKQDLQTLGRLQTAVDEVVADLGTITPPDEIAPLHRALIRQTGEYRQVIKAAQAGFASENPRAIDTARGRFSTQLAAVAAKVTATINTINAKLK
jgi:hypothetical protein